MTFEAFRENGAPTYYDELKTPWEADLVTSGLVFAFLIIAFSFFVILPGKLGWERLFCFIRVTLSLTIGAVILVSQFSMTWEVAETSARTKYKAGTGAEVNVTIGAWIGFRGVNITMEGSENQIPGEKINYNENFNWEGLQGRLGFGPFAGRFNQEYRSAQFRGLPLPILWAAEYFTFDGEGIRWGRFYRQAGWYAHIMLWLAFPLWILSNVLFFVLLRFGAYFLAMTGASMLVCNIIWATLRNVNDLAIPYSDTAVLEFSYGGSFWACLVTGIVCLIFAAVILVMDKLNSSAISKFFNVDVLQDSEQIIEEDYDDTPPEGKAMDNGAAGPSGAHDGAPGPSYHDDDEYEDDDELYMPPPPVVQAPTAPEDRAAPTVIIPPVRKYTRRRTYRSGENRMTNMFQKPRRRAAPPVPTHHMPHDTDGPFDNVQLPTRAGNAQDSDSSGDDDNYVNAQELDGMRMQKL